MPLPIIFFHSPICIRVHPQGMAERLNEFEIHFASIPIMAEGVHIIMDIGQIDVGWAREDICGVVIVS